MNIFIIININFKFHQTIQITLGNKFNFNISMKYKIKPVITTFLNCSKNESHHSIFH
jgi:hypothetical protein